MTLDLVDLIWSGMREDEFYTPSDLANILEQPLESVTRVLEFLKKYKFAQQITRREMIFRRIAYSPSPSGALRVLQTVLSGVRVERTERANASEARRRFNASI
jgi:hypothetical protein